MKTYLKLFLLLVVVTGLKKIFGLPHPWYGIDDANIYFVYVRNFVNGLGFVYSPGGERVEGFTSLFWVLLLSLLYLFKAVPFEYAVLVLCFILTFFTIKTIFKYVQSEWNNSQLSYLAVAAVLLTPGFIEWSVFGLMDTSLWIFATTYCTVTIIKKNKEPKDNYYITILCFLLPLIRPEGLMFTFIVAVLWYVVNTGTGSLLKGKTRYLRPLLAGALAVTSVTVFRYLYFGYPVPNTFYAKVSMSVMDNIRHAFFYLYDSFRHTTVIPFLLLGIILISLIRNKYWQQFLSDWRTNALLLITGFFIVYPFLSGGDHFKYSRFFQTVYPLIFLFFVKEFGQQLTVKGWKSYLAVFLFFVLLNGNSTDETSVGSEGIAKTIKGYFKNWSLDIFSISQLQPEFDIANNGRQIGDRLNRIFGKETHYPSFAVTAAGGIAYVYKGEVVDVLGLNNVEMAHADKIKHGVKNHGSFNKRIFYEQRPMLFLSWPDPVTDFSKARLDSATAKRFDELMHNQNGFINQICRNVFSDSLFKARYRFCEISGNGDSVYSYTNNQLNGIKSGGLLIKELR